MKVPNCENAYIDIEKIRDYCLNDEHPRGKHKAIVFKSVLELNKKDAELLKRMIQEGVQLNDAEETFKDEYGVRFTVDIPQSIKDNRAVIRTLWIIKTNEDFPRLITCYVKR